MKRIISWENSPPSAQAPLMERTPRPGTNGSSCRLTGISCSTGRVGCDEAAARIGTLTALVEQHAATDQQIRYFISAAMICLRRDRYAPGASSRAYLQAARALAQGSALAQSVPAIQFQLGFLHLWHGAQADAEEHLRAALHLAERSGDITLQARCLTYLACIARQHGDVEDVRQRTAQLLEGGYAGPNARLHRGGARLSGLAGRTRGRSRGRFPAR